jgi:undecaprenyl-diphosphatase
LLVARRVPVRDRTLDEGRWHDAVAIGIAQATALVPGISRSGITIGAGLGRGFSPVEAARYSFLLAVPAIAGGGLLSLLRLGGSEVDLGPLAVGLIVAAVSGYAAIAWLLRLLVRVGFLPFAVYCLVVGGLGIVML